MHAEILIRGLVIFYSTFYDKLAARRYMRCMIKRNISFASTGEERTTLLINLIDSFGNVLHAALKDP